MEIKFSSNYDKLWNQTSAELLSIKIINAEDVQLNKDLLEYGNLCKDDKKLGIEAKDKYQLPKTGKLIQLVFLVHTKYVSLNFQLSPSMQQQSRLPT